MLSIKLGSKDTEIKDIVSAPQESLKDQVKSLLQPSRWKIIKM